MDVKIANVHWTKYMEFYYTQFAMNVHCNLQLFHKYGKNPCLPCKLGKPNH